MYRLIILIVISLAANTSGRPDTALWLARSCVGEAGFEAYETGECAAIAHIYAKRARMSGRTFDYVMHRYSAAIRPEGKIWVRGLRRDGKRPPRFGLEWSRYRDRWMATLKLADRFVEDDVTDPLPEALHYGGWIDRGRLDKRVWERIPSDFQELVL